MIRNIKFTGCVFIPLLAAQLMTAQQNSFEIRTIAFYNLENLFDTINNPLTFDDDRTPEGRERWTEDRYRDKVSKLAGVIAGIGSEITKSAPDIIGVCEIENEQVLSDLIGEAPLREYHYGIIHANSMDIRGIDVALLYRKNIFTPFHFEKHFLKLADDDGEKVYTRDQLVVSGMLDGEEIHFIVNHWPSRRGGEQKSGNRRKEAAHLNRRIIDSLRKINPYARIIGMGDFNDNPDDLSLKKILGTKGKLSDTDSMSLYNPMEKMFKRGMGTLAHRDQWNLFDQFYITASLISEDKTGFTFWKSGIYNTPKLTTQSGPYRGYPLRSYANGNYTGGYSDHFPVYIYLIRKSQK